MRDSNKSSDVFTWKQKPNNERNDYYEAMNEDNPRMQEDMLNPIAFFAINNTNNLYYHQAMKPFNKREFQKVIIQELNAHIRKMHW